MDWATDVYYGRNMGRDLRRSDGLFVVSAIQIRLGGTFRTLFRFNRVTFPSDNPV